ncbi:hypothetical protein GBAR_LOCUS19920 [Geodia barretti]|nr:hypothetical protein GBAR_LOCUS19920 [Geodia barretti]
MAKMFEKEQVILEQSECLRNAQSQIRALEVKCSTLSRSLESAQDELTQCLEKQTTLQAAVEQARRENIRIVEGIEEEKAKQKVHISSVELKLSEEYQKLKESYDAMLNEKKEYDTQLELLNETIKEYETLNANKEVELDTQLQALRQSEWQKRVVLERENTVLQEKLAAHEREMRALEEKSKSQQTTLQDHVQELSTKCMALEAEAASLKAEQQHQNEKQTEMELQILMEKNYKKKHQCLQSQYKRLLETKQQLENDCAKLQSTVCALELTVSDANKEVAHLAEIHQQTLDIERQNLQDENAELLRRLNEEELQVKQLLNALEDEKKHSKKVCRHYKKKMMHLNESMELARAKQVKVEEEKESIRKSLTLDTAKLKNQIYKLKRRESEFNILLQGGYRCSGGDVPGYSMSKQGNGVLSFADEDSPPVIAQPPSS